MLFGIDQDTEWRVAGWVVPDHPSVEPVVRVHFDGGRARLAATEPRDELKTQGLHPTGRCGFVVDSQTCPGLRPGAAVEVYEDRSNLLVYRRLGAGAIPLRLFQLETQTAPFIDLERELAARFQMTYSSLETVAEEAMLSILNIDHTPSVFVAGGALYRRFEPYLTARGFRRIVLLCDPFRELAARLMRLQALAAEDGRAGWKSLGQARLIDAFGTLDLTRRPLLDGAFDRLEAEELYSLADPVTRKLASTYAGEPLAGHHVELALESLADFDVIGFENDLGSFTRDVALLLGLPVLSARVDEEPDELAAVKVALEACPAAQELVAFDVEVAALAHDALDQVSGQGQGPGGIR